MGAWVESGDRRMSADELKARGARAARGFVELGIGEGDVVALYLRNDLVHFEVVEAATLAGAYSTPVNWHNSVDEAAYVFANSGAKAIVIHSDLYHAVAPALPEGVPVFVVETPKEVREAYGLDDATCRMPEGRTAWADFVERNAPLERAAPGLRGAMIYTSGTTGHPKGVRRDPITQEQQDRLFDDVGHIFGYADWLDRPTEMVTVITGPLYHSAPNGYSAYMFSAGANIILQPRFDTDQLLALIEARKITHLHMVPTMFVRLLRLPDEVKNRYDLSSLAWVVHAAAPCPPHVKRAMIDWWGPVIHEYYGGTETGAVAACGSADWLAHPGSVGKIIGNAEVKVLGENGELVGPNVTGEIVCRFHSVPDFTYHGDDDKRRRAEKSGLISLGDVGYLDDDGFLYLCDRTKDMIISGGVNIYPAEIEGELLKMPGVSDCAVFGIPDGEFGEQVYAVVQPSGDFDLASDQVRAFLRERIAGYKVPKQVEFRPDLPREDSGKIFKRKLREPFWADAGRSI